MKVDLPTPGTPETPSRNAGRAGGEQRGEQRVGALAMVGAGRFEQRDRLGDGAPLPLARRGEHRVEQLLIAGRQHRDAAAPRGARASERLICSSTSFALAGIGVPGP